MCLQPNSNTVDRIEAACSVDNKLVGTGGMLPWENFNFPNLKTAILDTLVQNKFFWVPPLKPYFSAWPPLKSHQSPPKPPPHPINKWMVPNQQ